MNPPIARPMPPLFVSHGSPMTALEPGAAGAFMSRLGQLILERFGRPRAILAVSAHTLARQPMLLAGEAHGAVYDFGGFDPRLNQLRYDAPGAPQLAAEVHARLAAGGLDVQSVDHGGLDHGLWIPLRFMFPAADVPVLPLAWSPEQAPAALFAMGELLAPLADSGVLLLASGSITHNLRRVFGAGMTPVDAPEPSDVAAFRAWMLQRSAARDWPALWDYRAQAPHAREMHPTDEHLLPWFIAAGAGGRRTAPRRLHDSVTHGVLGMDAYGFGPLAEGLARAAADAEVA